MRRRTYLATTALALSLGGCTAPDSNSTNTSTGNETSPVATADQTTRKQPPTESQPDATPTDTSQETTPQRTPSEAPLKIDYEVAEVKQNAKTINYDTLIQNINDYRGEPVYYEYAEIYRVVPGEASSQIQMNVSTRSQDPQGVIEATWVGDGELIEGYSIQFWGFVRGLSEYETIQGDTIIVPSIQMVDYTFQTDN